MSRFNPTPALDLVAFIGVVVGLSALTVPTHGQTVTPCSAAMISSFTPCFNFVTNSSANGTTPTADCCNSVKSLANTGLSCFCLIVTGSVPFQLPVNRTLALTLPRACNMPGIPVQCKASGAPIPAPGPSQLGSSPSPAVSPSANPQAPSSAVFPGAATPNAPPDVTSPPPPAADSGSPPSSTTTTTTTTPGSRPALTPSSANRPLSYSAASSASLLMMIVLGLDMWKKLLL